MAWSGGTYSKGTNVSGGWVGDASVGIGIEAGRHDTQDNDFATGINTCIAKNGQNAATADLPMATFKHTNIGNATARNQYSAVGQVQDGDFIWLGTTAGTAIAQTASATPAITAYKAGQKFRMKIGATLGSTGSVATAHTLQINGIASPKNIVNNEDSTNPTLGTWIAGAIMEVVYDGTNFVITNDPGGWLSFTPSFGVSAGGTSGEVNVHSLFRKHKKTIELQFYYQWTQTVAPAGFVAFTPPVNAATNLQMLSAMGWLVSSVTGFALFNPVSLVNIYNYNQSAFALGASQILVSGIYRSV